MRRMRREHIGRGRRWSHCSRCTACTSSKQRQRGANRRPGQLRRRRHGHVAGEGRPDDVAGQGVQRHGQGQARQATASSSARRTKSSGAAAQLLSTNWDEGVDGPRPVVWSPAASSWGADREPAALTDSGQPPIVARASRSCSRRSSIAMPKPMADALGYPDKPIGWTDILHARQGPAGLGGVRPSGVGPVQARQDQPELLDQRAQRADRADVRGDRQDDRAVGRGPRQARRSSTSARASSPPSCTTATRR